MSLDRGCAFSLICLLGGALGLVSCATVPTPKVVKHSFPQNAYVGEPKGKHYQSLGMVRTKVNYASLTPEHEEGYLCKNYFNKAAADLVKIAKKQGADAVIDVRSVVFLFDGRVETHPQPECSDDGGEGQVLAQGIAVKWVIPNAGPGTAPAPVKEKPVKATLGKKPAPGMPDPRERGGFQAGDTD